MHNYLCSRNYLVCVGDLAAVHPRGSAKVPSVEQILSIDQSRFFILAQSIGGGRSDYIFNSKITAMLVPITYWM